MVHCWPQLGLVVHLSSSRVSYTVEKAKWFLVEQTIVAGGLLLLVLPPRPKNRDSALDESSSTSRSIFGNLMLLVELSVTTKNCNNHHPEEEAAWAAYFPGCKRPDCLTSSSITSLVEGQCQD